MIKSDSFFTFIALYSIHSTGHTVLYLTSSSLRWEKGSSRSLVYLAVSWPRTTHSWDPLYEARFVLSQKIQRAKETITSQLLLIVSTV